MDKFAKKTFYLWFATGWYMSYLIIPRIIWRILCGAWGPFKRKKFYGYDKKFLYRFIEIRFGAEVKDVKNNFRFILPVDTQKRNIIFQNKQLMK